MPSDVSIGRSQARRKRWEELGELDQSALNGVHYRFQSIVSPQLLVDVVKVIAQGLKANLEALRNFGGVLSGGKEPQNLRLLFGKRGHGRHGWSVVFGNLAELMGHLQHFFGR